MKRALMATGVTVVMAILLYHCRWLTFAIWTNAAMIDHRYPLSTVALIEFVLVAAIWIAIWFAVGDMARKGRGRK